MAESTLSSDVIRKRNTRAKRKSLRQCTGCGSIPRKGVSLCDKCNAKNTESNAKYRKKQRANGLCCECRSPVSDKTICAVCSEKRKEKYRERRDRRASLGQCVSCERPPVIGNLSCEMCLLKMYAHSLGYKLKSGAWRILRDKLERQKYRCAYTGQAIRIGVNASIDHILPVARGGDNSLDNLQWTTTVANQMKLDATESEFFSAVKDIYLARVCEEVNNG